MASSTVPRYRHHATCSRVNSAASTSSGQSDALPAQRIDHVVDEPFDTVNVNSHVAAFFHVKCERPTHPSLQPSVTLKDRTKATQGMALVRFFHAVNPVSWRSSRHCRPHAAATADGVRLPLARG